MRKVLILSLVLVYFNVSNAQTSFGLKGGVNFANLKVSGDGVNMSFDSRVGINAGAFATFITKQNFQFQPELLISMEGAKSQGDEIKLTYLNLPLMVGYNISGFTLETGPQFGALLSAKSNDVDVKDQMETLAVSWGVGAAYKLPGGFGIGARYNFGLSNISKESGGGKMRSNVFQIGLSFAFPK
jgi:hypothetical protein